MQPFLFFGWGYAAASHQTACPAITKDPPAVCPSLDDRRYVRVRAHSVSHSRVQNILN